MTQIDKFESVFRGADKPVFHYEAPAIRKALLVCDLDRGEAERLLGQVRRFLAVLKAPLSWEVIEGARVSGIREMLAVLEELTPDLVVSYRHLHSDGWHYPYGLGEYLEVLTQGTDYRVLVLPHPEAGRALPHSLENTDRVMAITDHLAGDHRLVNHALRCTGPGGACDLAHVTDGVTFDRLVETISKIPEIDTVSAGADLLEQMQKEPRDYVVACRRAVEEQGLDVHVGEVVMVGHRLSEYQRLVEEHKVDLLVCNTRDEDQLAMHGLVHPLAVQLRQVPMLML